MLKLMAQKPLIAIFEIITSMKIQKCHELLKITDKRSKSNKELPFLKAF